MNFQYDDTMQKRESTNEAPYGMYVAVVSKLMLSFMLQVNFSIISCTLYIYMDLIALEIYMSNLVRKKLTQISV